MRLDEWWRRVCSVAPRVGLVPGPPDRPNGITAMVRVRGAEPWVEPCLRSIQEFADEVVVLDNGATPATADTIQRLAPCFGTRLRVEHCPDLDLFALSNLGLECARQRWVIRWDADFVAHTDGDRDIRRLREFLLALDRRRYHVVYLPAAEVAGDLVHQFPDRRVRRDGSVHTASSRARYVAVERDIPLDSLSHADRVLREGPTLPVRFESIQLPPYYRVHEWPTVSYLHVDVKSRRHMLLRHFWLEWLRATPDGRHPALEAWAHVGATTRWRTSDPDAAAAALVARYCEGLVPYDPVVCGPHPAMLRPYLDQRRYCVEYADGRIVGRVEPT